MVAMPENRFEFSDRKGGKPTHPPASGGDTPDDPALQAGGDVDLTDDIASSPDLEIEQLISAGGVPAREAGHPPTSAQQASAQSLDELLDTFADEGLAAEAFAEAESYSALAPRLTPLQEPRPVAPAPTPARAQPSTLAGQRRTASADTRPAEASSERLSLNDDVTAREAETTLQRARRTAQQRSAERAGQPAVQVYQTPPRDRGAFWRGLGLVLLGGLLGVALTLLGLMIWSGTLSFASRAHVEALSRNMGTMQSNQELAWQRLDIIGPQVSSQEARLAQAEQELQALRAEASASETRVETLSLEVETLRQELGQALALSEERMVTLEGQTTRLDEGLTELTATVTPLQAAVERFDGFLDAMRDLLVELQGAP